MPDKRTQFTDDKIWQKTIIFSFSTNETNSPIVFFFILLLAFSHSIMTDVGERFETVPFSDNINQIPHRISRWN